jgi:hypothetical protein
MACWAAKESRIPPNGWTFVSTDSLNSHSPPRGMRLTMDDLIFAPGYRNGRHFDLVERELRLAGVDLPDGLVVDFEDSR